MLIGQKVELRINCMGNPPYTPGYVYDTYRDFDVPSEQGVGVIFPNGEYCGFSKHEQELFFRYDEHVEINFEYSKYKFTNVIQLSRDFDKGFWRF